MKKYRSNWPKHLLQWGSLAAIVFFVSGLAKKLFPSLAPSDPEALCPLGGLEALSTYLQRGSLPCSMSSLQIMMGIALAVAVIFFGKLFCSYLCPIGTVEDLLIRLRKAIGYKAVEIKRGGVPDKILRIVKYALLFYVIYMTVSASELFCKNLDPYYAVATGFKGEITLWMSLVTIGIVILLGLVIDRFWCKYVCPLGAISTSLKFWVWLLLLTGIYWGLGLAGVNIAWFWLLGAFCLCGYLMEVFKGETGINPVGIIEDEDRCTKCKACKRACPYDLDPSSCNGKVNDVDCVLCGECIAACPFKVLSVGSKPNKKNAAWKNYLPAILTVLFVIGGFIAGNSFELPTIDEHWDVADGMKLETVKVEGLPSVKCYGSSRAFKGRMERVPGVHGVKTYVGSHTVVVSFDPSETTADAVKKAIFVPSRFRVSSPKPADYDSVKVVTIRTEHMGDKLDITRFGMLLRQSGRRIFGVESEYDCPLVIRIYMATDENPDEAWYRGMVETKALEMTAADGSVTVTPLAFEFVRMEDGCSYLSMPEYLTRMFDTYSEDFTDEYEAEYVYEISSQSYEKPIIRRSVEYLASHISEEKGIVGLDLKLNDSLVPSIQIRFAAPATPESIWERITSENWTIHYSNGEVKQEPARIKFSEPGVCRKLAK